MSYKGIKKSESLLVFAMLGKQRHMYRCIVVLSNFIKNDPDKFWGLSGSKLLFSISKLFRIDIGEFFAAK